MTVNNDIQKLKELFDKHPNAYDIRTNKILAFVEPGPWSNEPMDDIKGVYKGYNYIVRRNAIIGNWCGYIQIPFTYAKSTDDLTVHGGITWNSKSLPDGQGSKKGFIWVGFDTCHSNDLNPPTLMSKFNEYIKEKMDLPPIENPFKPTYKTVGFCINEIYKLIDQLG